jgi:TPR repeat protein
MKKIFIALIASTLLYAEPTVQEIIDSCDDRDYKHGCEMLGNMYMIGIELKRDKKKAFYYYKKACDLGLSSSCKKVQELQAPKINYQRQAYIRERCGTLAQSIFYQYKPVGHSIDTIYFKCTSIIMQQGSVSPQQLLNSL